MRYSVQSQDYNYTLRAVSLANGKSVKEARNCGLVFCDLTDVQITSLRSKGLVVKLIRPVSSLQVRTPRRVEPTGGTPLSGASVAYATALEEARAALTPPLTGRGFNLAILDTGIRASHIGFEERIVYSKNFSASPTIDDIFSHGTACAWLAAAGRDENGIVQGIAPEAGIMNIKVLGDSGEGNEESVILGMDDVMGLDESLRPVAINLSLGAPDDGDPNNPMRVACRAAFDLGIGIFAAAGNNGPDPQTVNCPGCDPLVIAVGALSPQTSTIFRPSSRGPTKEGEVKPDIVFYGDDLLLADSSSDVGYSVKAGTSFACAGMAGLGMLYWEVLTRFAGRTMVVPGTNYAYTILPGWEPLPDLLKVICVKPEGTPTEKDSTYGWGIPLGSHILDYFSPIAALQLSQVIIPFVTIMFLAVLLKVVTGIAR